MSDRPRFLTDEERAAIGFLGKDLKALAKEARRSTREALPAVVWAVKRQVNKLRRS